MDPLAFIYTIPDDAPAGVTGRVITEEEERVSRRVESLLEWLTQHNFEKVKNKLIEVITGTASAAVLKILVSTIFKMAESRDGYILLARLCSELNDKLPGIPSEKPGMRVVTFERLLHDKCIREFDSAVKRVYHDEPIKNRVLWTLRFVAELYKQKMIPEEICHYIIQMLLKPERMPNMYIEAACQLLSSIGKQLDTSPISRRTQHLYFEKLNDLAVKQQLTSRLRVMVLGLLALRVNDWVATTESTHSQQQTTNSATASTGNDTSNRAEETEQEPNSAARSSSVEGNDLPASKPKDAEDEIYEQVKTSIAVINILKEEVNKERLERTEAEKDAAMANQKVAELESRFDDEVKLRKETEDALAIKEEEIESLKQVIQVHMKEKDDWQVERDNLLKLTEDLLKNQSEEASVLAMVRLEEPQPPSCFICPISQEIMNDPQVAADGFSYEAEDMRGWLDSGHDTSPMTNLKLPNCSLVPNRTLRSAIQEWLQRNQ